MFCTKCGLKIDNENANFCKRCGFNIKKKSNPKQSSDIFQRAKQKIINFSNPKIEKTKKYTVNKIDSVQEKISNPSKFEKLSQNQRTYLANRLANLKNKLVSDPNIEMTIEEAKEIQHHSEELIEQLKEDKCLICYKTMIPEESSNTKIELIVCPLCGNGGHKNHLSSWFQDKSSCPYCKAEVKIEEALLLII